MQGLHYNDTLSGKLFMQPVTPLGLALPIYTATAIGGAGICALPLWNPPGSNVIVELVSVDIDYGSGTADYGSVVLMGVPLNGVFTGSPCTALATTIPINGYLGGGNVSKVSSNNGAGTCTVVAGTAVAPTALAPGLVRNLADINLEAQTGTPQGVGIHTYVFNGTLSVPPGWMVYLASMRATTGALFASTLIWKEWFINSAVG